MWRYIVAHWRGELSLPRTVLLDGLLVYVLITIFAGLVETISTRVAVFEPQPLVWASVVAMVVWLVWAIVGIVRCVIRLLRDPAASVWSRLWAILAVLAAMAFAFGPSSDLYRLGSAFR